jgi:Kef-type K+ transport system membrane component KefB/Trk K+ transport system NAD-binding subunit
MLGDVYIELSLVITLGAAIAFILHKLRQPLLIGYILTGIIAGPAVLDIIHNNIAFAGMSQIGIALLLFIIGLDVSPRVFFRLRKTIFITTLVQISLTGMLGFAIAKALSFGDMESAIIGLCLALSSTIIIVKLFNDKRETMRLYAQIIIGILILQDVFVTAGKFGLATRTTDGTAADLISLIAMGLTVTGLLYLSSRHLLPRLTKSIGSSKEILLLFALGWGLGWALLFERVGFSIEIGALFAGIGLAQLPYSREMSSRLKPLRDFFIVIFFITLGQGLLPGNMSAITLSALIFSLFVLFIKPLMALISLALLGYTKRTSFKAAVSLSQISEFSLVFVMAAVHTGLASQQLANMLTLVALITFAVSTYFIKYDNVLFAKLDRHLRLFERKTTLSDRHTAQHHYPIVLFGYRRNSNEFVKTFRKMEKPFVIIDYDPYMVEALENSNEEYMYGDATDSEFLDELQLQKSKLVLSTISDFKTNEFLAQWLAQHNPGAVFVCSSDNAANASALYAEGASYVMMPHFVGNERLSAFIRKNGFNKAEFKQYREKHLAYLETHPEFFGAASAE